VFAVFLFVLLIVHMSMSSGTHAARAPNCEGYALVKCHFPHLYHELKGTRSRLSPFSDPLLLTPLMAAGIDGITLRAYRIRRLAPRAIVLTIGNVVSDH